MTMAKPTKDDLRNRFLYHAPGPDARPKHAQISERCLAMAEWLVETCPEGRDLSLALTHLEDVRMRANAAIAMTQPLAG
jgi:hypothetical protein